MIPVDNRRIITRLANSQYKGNRSRNRLLIIGIFLATFMLTSVASLGINYYQAVTERNIKLDGSLYDATVFGANRSQITAAKKLPNVQYAGLMISCANLTEFENKPIETSLVWSDAVNWQHQVLPALEYFEGTYPQNATDLLLSRKALKKMGIATPQLGMKLPVTYATESGPQQQVFHLSGYFHDYSNKNRGFVSETFFKHSKVSLSDPQRGRLYLSFYYPFISDRDVNNMTQELGLVPPQLLRADTELFRAVQKMMLVMSGLLLLVMLSAYLLIYNMVYLSINKDIHYYGLLKTIGTTRRQIKAIVFRQMFRVSLIGIPLGLSAGALLSFVLIPTLLKAVSVYALTPPAKMNPLIFIGAALFALLTVYLSTRQPARLASGISPIAALHYSGLPVKNAPHKGRHGGKLIPMAWRNIFRQKKRALVVFLSLFMGLTAFLTITSLLDSTRADRVLDNLTTSDLVFSNKTSAETNRTQQFDATLLTQITQLNGVKSSHAIAITDALIPFQPTVFGDYVTTMYESYMNETYDAGLKRMAEHPEEFMGILVGIDGQLFDDIAENSGLTLSKKDFLAGKSCIVDAGWHFASALATSSQQTVNLMVNHTPLALTIGGISTGKHTPNVGYSGFYPNILVSQQLVAKLVDPPFIDSVLLRYEDSYDRELEKQLLALINNRPGIDYESKIERYDGMSDSENQLAIFGYTLALVLASLGIMNYLNLMTTSIVTRAREFATLQSIGMTRQQLKGLVIAEGLGYGLVSLSLVLTLGTAIAYSLFQLNNVDQMPFRMPFWPLFSVICIILVICSVIPLVIFNRSQRGSLIEQLNHD